MPDLLSTYRQKRNFDATPEPPGKTVAAADALTFVIQKHAASRLHYDFRLELDGTLKSWAVPKGPSLDPAQKRMAVQVEDHPLAYGSFEGVIPPKQYGAGTVIVWDRGTWHPVGDPREGYRNGKLKFRLDGEKLHGLWMLVAMHGRANERQPPWLLIKERDEFARPAAEYNIVDALPTSVLSAGRDVDAKAADSGPNTKAAVKAGSRRGARNASSATAARNAIDATTSKKAKVAKPAAKAKKTDPAVPEGTVQATLPKTLAPELATLVAGAPSGDGWTYEIKFDGYRILARIEDGEVRLLTRNGNDWTAKLGGIARELGALGIESGWLDGEIIVLDEHGASAFGALQNAFDAGGARILYCVFDLPYFGGHDLRAVKLEERRAVLERVLGEAKGKVRFSQDFHADAADILRNACRLRLEGVIGKRLGSAYVSRRSADWIKLKCTLRQEFVIGGYTEPKGSRTGAGSLLLGIHDEQGKLRYAGNVGSGFDTKTLAALRRELDAIETPTTPFFEKPREAKGTWVEPKLVAEVSFAEWTRDGKVRHAVFHGLRSDKPAEKISREVAAPVPRGAAASPAANVVTNAGPKNRTQPRPRQQRRRPSRRSLREAARDHHRRRARTPQTMALQPARPRSSRACRRRSA